MHMHWDEGTMKFWNKWSLSHVQKLPQTPTQVGFQDWHLLFTVLLLLSHAIYDHDNDSVGSPTFQAKTAKEEILLLVEVLNLHLKKDCKNFINVETWNRQPGLQFKISC